MNRGEYSIEQHPKVVSDDIPRLGHVLRKQILRVIFSKLLFDPLKFGKPLRQSLKRCRTLRVGDYRVVYTVIGKRVRIQSIRHRNKGYEGIEDRVDS